MENRTQQPGGLSTPADFAALAQLWLNYDEDVPIGFTQLDLSKFDTSAGFEAVALQEDSTGNIIFVSRPLNPGDGNSIQQAYDMGENPGSSTGVTDMQNFVSGVLSNPNISYNRIFNVGWSLAGAYATVAVETEFANFNVGSADATTYTFGSAPQTPAVAYLESQSHSNDAPDGRSWAVVNAVLGQTTNNFAFTNDPVYMIDQSLGKTAADVSGTEIPPLTNLSDAAVAGYSLNSSPNLLFGTTTQLGAWASPWSPYWGALGRIPPSHMIENYTISVPGNNFAEPMPGFLRRPTAVPPPLGPISI